MPVNGTHGPFVADIVPSVVDGQDDGGLFSVGQALQQAEGRGQNGAVSNTVYFSKGIYGFQIHMKGQHHILRHVIITGLQIPSQLSGMRRKGTDKVSVPLLFLFVSRGINGILDLIIIIKDAVLFLLRCFSPVRSIYVFQEDVDGVAVNDGMEEVKVKLFSNCSVCFCNRKQTHDEHADPGPVHGLAEVWLQGFKFLPADCLNGRFQILQVALPPAEFAFRRGNQPGIHGRMGQQCLFDSGGQPFQVGLRRQIHMGVAVQAVSFLQIVAPLVVQRLKGTEEMGVPVDHDSLFFFLPLCQQLCNTCGGLALIHKIEVQFQVAAFRQQAHYTETVAPGRKKVLFSADLFHA